MAVPKAQMMFKIPSSHQPMLRIMTSSQGSEIPVTHINWLGNKRASQTYPYDRTMETTRQKTKRRMVLVSRLNELLPS